MKGRLSLSTGTQVLKILRDITSLFHHWLVQKFRENIGHQQTHGGQQTQQAADSLTCAVDRHAGAADFPTHADHDNIQNYLLSNQHAQHHIEHYHDERSHAFYELGTSYFSCVLLNIY